MKKLVLVTVQGTHKEWGFEVLADLKYLADWRNDGLQVEEICNTIPDWVVAVGLTRPWVCMQDLLNFKNPWSTV